MSTALSAAVATAAFAQTPSSPSSSSDTPAAKSESYSPPAAKSEGSGKMSFVSSQKPDQWLASKFKGTDVLGSDNQSIGDVSDILFDKSGKVEAFIVSVGVSSAWERRKWRSRPALSTWSLARTAHLTNSRSPQRRISLRTRRTLPGMSRRAQWRPPAQAVARVA